MLSVYILSIFYINVIFIGAPFAGMMMLCMDNVFLILLLSSKKKGNRYVKISSFITNLLQLLFKKTLI